MGAMCDPVFMVTVTCRECGWQERFHGDDSEMLIAAMHWHNTHMSDSHRLTEQEYAELAEGG